MKGMERCMFCGRSMRQVYKMVKAPANNDIFICDKCIDICSNLIREDGDKDYYEYGGHEVMGLEGMTPSQIHAELNRFVIGQEYAKKVLSVAIYNHNKRLNDRTGLIKKSNILIAGPSGCGKTLLAKTLAKMLGVPFVITDATSLTEAGYVGDDVEVCLQSLITAADGDIERAQRGIVYIDEIDKIARAGENRSITRDVSGQGVQESLLKIIEGCTVAVPLNDRRKHPQGNNVQFDTSNVLFICGGAFEGLFDSDSRKPVGFNSTYGNGGEDEKTANEKLTPQALKKYGMMPELIGRLQIRCALTDLKEEELVRVLTEPEDAITKEYKALFKKDNIKLTYEDEALHKIAKLAIENKSGARGLRTIIEDIMLDVMYEVPDMDDVSECIVTEKSIETKEVQIKHRAKYAS